MKTYEFLVSGLVQGVGYRAFVRENALKKAFKGYVKNLPDGRVKAVANIDNEENFKEFLDILKTGSFSSKVENIEFKEIPFMEFNSFEIRY